MLLTWVLHGLTAGRWCRVIRTRQKSSQTYDPIYRKLYKMQTLVIWQKEINGWWENGMRRGRVATRQRIKWHEETLWGQLQYGFLVVCMIVQKKKLHALHWAAYWASVMSQTVRKNLWEWYKQNQTILWGVMPTDASCLTSVYGPHVPWDSHELVLLLNTAVLRSVHGDIGLVHVVFSLLGNCICSLYLSNHSLTICL